jgi:hypothetical protein
VTKRNRRSNGYVPKKPRTGKIKLSVVLYDEEAAVFNRFVSELRHGATEQELALLTRDHIAKQALFLAIADSYNRARDAQAASTNNEVPWEEANVSETLAAGELTNVELGGTSNGNSSAAPVPPTNSDVLAQPQSDGTNSGASEQSSGT